MSNRLTKIYTKTGDTGSTGLGDGTRTLKCSDRIEAIGTVDELNCVIGLLLCESLPDQVSDFLTKVQHQLFDLGSELSVPGYSAITDNNIENIENELDAMNLNLEPLKEFILPGGSRSAAFCHQARAVCRRAERCVIRLEQNEKISELSKKYLNRLSDYLFVACRTINKSLSVEDVYWSSKRMSGS
jgi:cob(I)alamin adenosyltransferase